MRDLYEIVVSVDPDVDDYGHGQISVGGVTYYAIHESPEEFGNPAGQAVLDAARYVAGIVGRVAVAAQTKMIEQREEHGCRRYGERCDISGSSNVLTPSCDSGDQPEVWFTVPKTAIKPWLDDIRGWLEAVVQSELAVWDF